MTAARWSAVPEMLSALEDLELPILSWGVTDAALSEDEVRAVLADTVTANLVAGITDGPTEAEYLQYLVGHALLHQVPGTSPARYRSRLGEGLRLLSALRQLFPPGRAAGSSWWRTGTPLVADYRLHVAPRRYPRRDIPAQDVIDRMSGHGAWSAVREDLAQALMGGRRLARFQVDATDAILTALAQTWSRGIVVGAGTGSGKTLAFYLPALVSAGTDLRPGVHAVHTLALYPRKELLRDQAREAVASGRRIATALSRHGLRPLRVGLLYADSPYSARDRRIGARGSAWRPMSGGARCPYFPCPSEGCQGDLVWRDADRSAGTERLACVRCGLVLESDVVALTRDSLVSRPPDVLFTTTEMLSRQASSERMGPLLGWRGASAPRLVLLDEVHTYAGVHGAQVALTLRRWRNAVRLGGGRPPVFAGLSATLQDAASFFATLVGLPESAVDYVTPAADDLVPAGREYAVVVRGDPVSGASLLSTSLQTAMLMGRLLNPAGHEGLFGSSGFLFTDDLDVTNRFYDDLRDAEGGQTRYRPGVARKPVLAQLRSPSYVPDGGSRASAQTMARYREGQAWHLAEQIGHPLSGRATEGALRIGRTSSQDAGVDTGADLVVATSSLEVGFNDPRVGLVMQHKAPHDPAAFIQRRGRAGRSLAMRPWTVVVLSDYGRDRILYQGYEQLFDPVLPPRRLPVRNRYVLKMQAVHALLDWVSRRVSRSGTWTDAREVLQAPRAGKAPHSRRRPVAHVLGELLTETSMQDELARHLQFALAVPAEDVQAVLWEEPRSLMLSAIPTGLRRLDAAWAFVDDDPGARPGDLLPEHITRALFEPLNVPDVEFLLPFAADDESPRMPILAALREAVPGRVSRRFGVERDEHRTWLPLPAGGDVLEVANFVARGQRLGMWAGAGGSVYEVIRPLQVKLLVPPLDVSDSTHALPVWQSELVLAGAAGGDTSVPERSRWSDLVLSARFALHLTGDPVDARRMVTGARGEVRYRDGRSDRTASTYAVDGRPVALGFSLLVDAFVVDVAPLDGDDPAVNEYLRTPSWRTRAFQTRVAEDAALNELAGIFQRDWLSLLYLTAYSMEALSCPAGTDLVSRMSGGAWLKDMQRMLAVLYRSADPDDPTHGAPERLVEALGDLGRESVVLDTIDRHAGLLLAPDIAAGTWDLAERSYADTLAAAVRHAILRAIPDAQDTDLVVDVVTIPDLDGARIVVSETSMGGLGLIEQLRGVYGRDPRRFWSLVTAAVGPSEYEDVDRSVRRLLTEAVHDPDANVARAMSAVRSAPGAVQADRALHDLIEAWTLLDGPPRHLAVAALSARFLRPGATAATDRDACRLLAAWDRMEGRIGAEIDSRVVAYAAAVGALPGDGEPVGLSADQIFSLLWPRGHQARSQHLQHWQPYCSTVLLDRLLVNAVVGRPVPAVDVTQAGWSDRFREILSVADAVELQAPGDRQDLLAGAVRRVGVIPVDREALRIFGRVGRLSRSGELVTAQVEVAEAYQ